MQPLISVIIPCYNVERYIGESLESVLSQDYQNLEILVVDDQSSDSTFSIATDYAGKDDRIKVLRNIGKGVAAARNTGLDNATGQFVAFVDSDDLIPSDHFSYLYALMEKAGADISVIKEQRFMDGIIPSPVPRSDSYKIMTGIETLREVFYEKILDVVWGRLYSRKIWEGVRFPEGFVYEDLALMYKIYRRAGTVVISPNRMYYYRSRHDSIMGSGLSQVKIDSSMQVIGMLEEGLVVPELRQSVVCRVINTCCSRLIQMSLNDKDASFFLDKIRTYRKEALADSRVRINKKIIMVASFVSVPFSIRLLKLSHWLKKECKLT